MAEPTNGNRLQSGPRTRPEAKCPNCGHPTETKYRPFCSKRCAELDLGKWLNEGYAIPVEDEEGEDIGGVEDDDGYEH